MNNLTTQIENKINALCALNDHTDGQVVDQMYLGSNVFVVSLKPKPRTIKGTWQEVERTVDIFDLMEEFQNEN